MFMINTLTVKKQHKAKLNYIHNMYPVVLSFYHS